MAATRDGASNLEGATNRGLKALSVRIDEHIIGLIMKCLGDQANDALTTEHSIIQMLYYYFSLCCGASTPGMAAVGLNIEDVDERTKYYPLVFLAVHWAAAKIQRLSYQEDWSESDSDQKPYKRAILKIANAITAAIRLTSFSNFVFFLAGGEHPSLIHRLSGSRMGLQQGSAVEGYKKSHLFIESRKMLWYTLVGVTSALSMTIDWRELKVYCFYIAHKVACYVRHGGSITHRLVGALQLLIRLVRRSFSLQQQYSSESDRYTLYPTL